jgi:DNA-binding MarR family transcriptional regulator
MSAGLSIIVGAHSVAWASNVSLNAVNKSSSDAEQYFIVDVPIRLTPTELARIKSVSTHGSPKSIEAHPFAATESKLSMARDRALEILAVRKRREIVFGADLFGEPAWDLMLDLFVQLVDRQKTSSTSAAIAARVPPTTALRYLTILVRKGLVVRHTSEHDLRLQYVGLSEVGYREMLALLSSGD